MWGYGNLAFRRRGTQPSPGSLGGGGDVRGRSKATGGGPVGIAAAAVAVMLVAGWTSAESGPRVSTTTARGTDPGGSDQATATPPGALPDLQIGWYYDHWWDGCISISQPRVLSVLVENAGAAAAGPFVFRDEQVFWRVPGLAPGASWSVDEWAWYPKWPLVLDPYNQVPESNEGNNVVAPDPNNPWPTRQTDDPPHHWEQR